jgi:DNA polymerase-1
MKLAFDLEADGLLDTVKKIHCLVARDVETDAEYVFGPNSIDEGVDLLNSAEVLWAHNGHGYDYQVLRRLCPHYKADTNKEHDTLRYVRLFFVDIADKDFRSKKVPQKLVGSHSLEAWGHRLGVHKGNFGKEHGFEVWTQEMQEYCRQDVVVLRTLILKEILPNIQIYGLSPQIEHRFGLVADKMCRGGVGFSMERAEDLKQTLKHRLGSVSASLQIAFPPDLVVTESPVKKVKKTKLVPFNPGSRQQIAERLKRLGWVPEKTTEKGQAQIDEKVLSGLAYPEAKLLAEFFELQKRVGQLYAGQNGLMKLVVDGKIHGSINTNGAVTGRCTHSSPNLAQIPTGKKPFGKEFRALFRPYTPGYVQVGADASGLELRCLAHYLSRYDNGAYTEIVTKGDVHTVNREAFGLSPDDKGRAKAKNGIYAVLYGAGDYKLGTTLFPELGVPGMEPKATAAGKKARKLFEKSVPAYAALVRDVKSAAEKGWIRGIDGRRLAIRSPHAALNTLLQSCGAIIVKYATILADPQWDLLGAHLMLHVHDEVQLEAPIEKAQQAGDAFVTSLQEAGSILGFRCPLAGSVAIGQSWADTH